MFGSLTAALDEAAEAAKAASSMPDLSALTEKDEKKLRRAVFTWKADSGVLSRLQAKFRLEMMREPFLVIQSASGAASSGRAVRKWAEFKQESIRMQTRHRGRGYFHS
jgi:hypothetical protein